MSKTHLFFVINILLMCGFCFVGYILHTVALNVNFNTKLNPNGSADKSYMEDVEVKNISNILILTSGRTGSSFLGKIFQQNGRKTRYVFEPLRKIFPNVFIADNLKFKAINILSDLFKHQNTANRTDQNNVVVKELNMRFPQNGSSSVLENLLRYSKSWNMRIIHLVRDPRHVISSMQRLDWFAENAGMSMELQIRVICETVWANMKYAQKRKDTLIKNRYKLVVFRNMMMHPYKTAESLYEFAGMGSVPASVSAWIKSSTNITENYEKSQPYGTNRNTKSVLSRKIAMSEDTRNFVHKHCGNIISFIQEFQKMDNI